MNRYSIWSHPALGKASRTGVCLVLAAALALPGLANPPASEAPALTQPLLEGQGTPGRLYPPAGGLQRFFKCGLILALVLTDPLAMSSFTPNPDGINPKVPDPGLSHSLDAPEPAHPCLSMPEAAPVWAYEERSVEVMGHGTLVALGPDGRRDTLTIGFRAASSTRPAQGFFTVSGSTSRQTFTGTVREVKVPERAPDGTPRVIHLAGESAYHDGTLFTCVIVAPDKERKQGAQLGLDIQDPFLTSIPPTPLSSGYLSIDGI